MKQPEKKRTIAKARRERMSRLHWISVREAELDRNIALAFRIPIPSDFPPMSPLFLRVGSVDLVQSYDLYNFLESPVAEA